MLWNELVLGAVMSQSNCKDTKDTFYQYKSDMYIHALNNQNHTQKNNNCLSSSSMLQPSHAQVLCLLVSHTNEFSTCDYFRVFFLQKFKRN